MRTHSIPMSDPRHPMHERLKFEKSWAGIPVASVPRDQSPVQYEDQYGNTRWSDTGDPVVHPSKDGR